MVKILGIFDLLAAAVLVGVGYGLALPSGLVITAAIYLFLKALIFLMDVGSWFDIAAGIFLILSLSIALPQLLFFILAGLLGFKGILSLFA